MMGDKVIKIVAISDTHNRYNKLTIPECDVLIDCGDFSFRGYKSEVENFYKWFNKQPAKHKISVWGNHELELSPEEMTNIALKECPDVRLLNDSECVIDGVKYYGSPVTPWFYSWAFNKARNEAEAMLHHIDLIKPHWDRIPKDTDVLITHGPAYDILDACPDGRRVGCEDLLKAIKRVKPDLHFSGHIHFSQGELHKDGTSHYNVAICDESYYPRNPITVVDYLTY